MTTTDHLRSRWGDDEAGDRPTAPGARLSEAFRIARIDRRGHAAAEHPSRGGLVRRLAEADPGQLVVDLRPPQAAGEGRGSHPDDNYGLGRNWGSAWSSTAQGWVGEAGAQSWRPIVTTTTDLSDWEVETYLGVITGEAAVDGDGHDAPTLGRVLAEGREVALRGLVDAAVTRGAHAVVGVSVVYTPLGPRLLVSATGTAVTLRESS